MEQITIIFSDFAVFKLHAMLAGVLLFAMLGVRSMAHEQINGYLYLSLSFIFLFFHWYLLLNMPLDSWPLNNLSIAGWLSQVLAPALILFILAVGIYDLLRGRPLVSAFKLFLGFSLMGILFNLGKGWSAEIQITLVLLWIVLWFKAERKTAQ
jgi:hypothetical protein